MKQRENQRTCFEVCYVESLPYGTIEETIRQLMPSEYAYILHDKDIEKTGELKKSHYHVYMKWETPIRTKTLTKALGLNSEKYQAQQCKDKSKAMQYMLHTLDKCRKEGKTIYDRKDLFSNIDSFTLDNLLSKNVIEKTNFQMIFDLINDFQSITNFAHEKHIQLKYNKREDKIEVLDNLKNNLFELDVQMFLMCPFGYQSFIMMLVDKGLIETFNQYYNSVFKSCVAWLR